MPQDILSYTARQWQQLTDFAEFLGTRFDLTLALVNSTHRQNAARFLCYIHDFKRGQWKEVEEYYAVNADTNGKIALAGQHPSVKIDKMTEITVQFRLFFTYASQYTIKPFDPVSLFLRDNREYETDEWESILATLEQQEKDWSVIHRII